MCHEETFIFLDKNGEFDVQIGNVCNFNMDINYNEYGILLKCHDKRDVHLNNVCRWYFE